MKKMNHEKIVNSLRSNILKLMEIIFQVHETSKSNKFYEKSKTCFIEFITYRWQTLWSIL